MLIYLAGPLSGVEHLNVAKALEVAVKIIQRGHVPIVPHLSVYTNTVAHAMGVDVPYERWMAMDLQLVRVCDALLFMGPSPGADHELALAEKLGLPVYRSLDEIGTVRVGRPIPDFCQPGHFYETADGRILAFVALVGNGCHVHYLRLRPIADGWHLMSRGEWDRVVVREVRPKWTPVEGGDDNAQG